jgi:hypothetical protein
MGKHDQAKKACTSLWLHPTKGSQSSEEVRAAISQAVTSNAVVVMQWDDE